MRTTMDQTVRSQLPGLSKVCVLPWTRLCRDGQLPGLSKGMRATMDQTVSGWTATRVE